MKQDIDFEIDRFVEDHKEETLSLLRELAAIPAPSYHEEKRAEFCLQWLREQGAMEAFVDEVGNVVFPYYFREDGENVVFMAHMDIVFADTDRLPIQEDVTYIHAPGVGDDTANLVNLLMGIKFLITHNITPDHGMLFVVNVCEEGLGNLKGSRYIFQKYGNSVETMVSFDLYYDQLVHKAVGSHRYEVVIRTKGGHSYSDFGNRSAVQVMADLIQRLYARKVPSKGKSTYNVGVVQGGTSVNTIPQEARFLYEFRSDEEASLQEMEAGFYSLIKSFQAEYEEMEESVKTRIEVQILGVRPCSSQLLDPTRMENLIERQRTIMESQTGMPVQLHAASTDANIPLSLGIPAVTFGTVMGSGLHTYEEKIKKSSMIPGQKIAIHSMIKL